MSLEKVLEPNCDKIIVSTDEEGYPRLTAIIFDEELDPVELVFDGVGCVQIECNHLTHLMFSNRILKKISKLIKQADKLSAELIDLDDFD